ncbi:hypothetical protein JW998_11920 [candidate division KSB1 bacterium]|nr:hypothetical protein [candidate division KSB1 bacterium]
MLQKYCILNDRLVTDSEGKDTIHVYSDPTTEERQHLIKMLDLDQHSLSSALDPDEISRLELNPALAFMIWKHPENYSFDGEIRFNVSSIGIALTSDQLVVILAQKVTLFGEQQISRMKNLIDVVLYILSQTTRNFLEHLKVIR